MKGIISWQTLDSTQKQHVISLNGERCKLCRSIGKFGLLMRTYIAHDCLNDLTFLYLMKRATGICKKEALEQTAETGVAWALFRARDDMIDLDRSFLSRTLSATILESYAGRENRLFRRMVKHIEQSRNDFESFEEWLDDASSYFRIAFEYGSPTEHLELMSNVGQSLGKLIAVKDAMNDRKRDRESGNFNPLNKFPKDSTLRKIQRTSLEISNSLSNSASKFRPEALYGNVVEEVLFGISYATPFLITGRNVGYSNSSSLCCLCISLGAAVAGAAAIMSASSDKTREPQKLQVMRGTTQKTLQEKIKEYEKKRFPGAPYIPPPYPKQLASFPHSASIKCQNCGHLNPSSSSYCGKCGGTLREVDDTRIYD